MNIIELNHIDLNSIGLNSKVIDSVGKSHGGKVKPYIKGHITDGSSTFTFAVNGNQSVTVPVDANGNWKWNIDRTITSLDDAFYGKTQLDSIIVANTKLNDCKSMQRCFKQSGITRCEFGIAELKNVTAFKECFDRCESLSEFVSNNIATSGNIDCYAIFNRATGIKIVSLPNAMATVIGSRDMFWHCSNIETIELTNLTFSGTIVLPDAFSDNQKLKNINIKAVYGNVSFKNSPILTEQSVVNLFNAVAADGITLTFHATVYAMIEEQLEIEGSPIYEAYWNSDYDFNYASA